MVGYELGILVFAERGVWYIYGPDSGFSATSYAVKKVTDYSIISPDALQEYSSTVMFASEEGLIVLRSNDFGIPAAINLTEQTINSAWKEFVINEDGTRNSGISMSMDRSRKQLHIVTTQNPSSYFNALIYDLRLEAWYPQSYRRPVGAIDVDIDEGVVFFSFTDTVFSLDKFEASGFTDWGVEFDSEIITSEETLGQFSHRKQIPNIYVIFRKTEENITGFDGTEYTYDNPSKCLFSCVFDYARSPTGILTSPERQIYNPNYYNFVAATASYPTPLNDNRTIVEYRDLVRGSGKAVKFRFRNDGNNDLQLLGYNVEFSMRGRQ
jgi:hypothetical protein